LNETPEEVTAKIVAQAATAAAKTVFEAAQAAAMVLAKESTTTNTAIAVLQAEVVLIKNQLVGLGPKFDKIFNKLDEVTLGRPTWAVAIIMGGLFSLCVGLIVFAVSGG
jgi:hypothetical protein